MWGKRLGCSRRSEGGVFQLFIDTNVLLRLYAFSDDALIEVEKLSELIRLKNIRLLVTEQVVDERARNRDQAFAESLKRIGEISTSVQIPRFAEHFLEAGELRLALEAAKAAKTKLQSAIAKELKEDGLKADKVIQAMFDSSLVLKRTEQIIERGRLRRELSNPPGKKDSIGDQINWEIMLEHVPEGEDLHIISRDGDFAGAVNGSPNFFLRGEWNHKKKANLFLYNGLSEFTKTHFPDIKVPADVKRASAVTKLMEAGSFQSTHSAISELEDVYNELTFEDALLLLTAATINFQITAILTDDDVKTFYQKLYSKFWGKTSASLDAMLVELAPEVFDVAPF